MSILGAHMSIAGGYYKSVNIAEAAGCDCVQLFTKSNKQWRAKPMTDKDVDLFQSALKTHKIKHCLSHASYLINLASPKEEGLTKSRDALVIELERADMLGIPYVVFHPGSFLKSDEAAGLKAIIESLDEVHQRTEELDAILLLENVAGQGTNLGWKFEQLQTMIEGVKAPNRVGVCIDTCHAFAAGYAMGSRGEYEATIEEMESTFGIDKIKAFHLNDSKKPFGSRRDRHEHIGQGEMGLEPFRNLLNDARFQGLPMYLETPKGENEDGEDFDVMNLATLRGLIE